MQFMTLAQADALSEMTYLSWVAGHHRWAKSLV
jgi:hypothetical protein